MAEDKNEKYVVFKREDWKRAINEANDRMDRGLVPLASSFTRLIDIEVDDAVVIRRQDVFAPPALAMYANSIRTALDVAQLHEVGDPNETARRLQAIADYFHEQSELAYADSRRSLPD